MNITKTTPEAKTPIYLSGAVRQELVGKDGFGFMMTQHMGNRKPEGSLWFGDNGLFSSKGERAFDLTKWITWLAKGDRSTCLGISAPDKVGDAKTTLERSLPVLPMIREMGYKAALVAQDGLEDLTIPWDAFDTLFIGGSTEWKLGPEAAAISREAKRRGKWVHMGRVNSYKRFKYAASIGCDSVDGTFLCFAPTINLARLVTWPVKLAEEAAAQELPKAA